MIKKIVTTSDFIAKARAVHGNKYDYSLSKYNKSAEKIKIICPLHGVFEQTPNAHLSGKGCGKCGIKKQVAKRTSTAQIFINSANDIHKNKYDYSKVEYINQNEKVEIICHKHGSFWQRPGSHLSGCGCPKCAVEMRADRFRSNTNEFIEKARLIHGDKYDYTFVNYQTATKKVIIMCQSHGIFEQSPNLHLNGRGCPDCANAKKGKYQQKTTEQFVLELKDIFGEKYDYSKIEYINNSSKVIMICPKHGEWKSIPTSLLHGHGCPICNGGGNGYNTETFITKAKEIHENKYDYSLVDYKNIKSKVKIICPEHGIFEQTPDVHLRSTGCPLCARSSQLEDAVRKALIENDIAFEEQVTQDRFNWLGRLSLDFYLPTYNLAIECQGEQHFHPVSFFGGIDHFDMRRERDIRKHSLCVQHGLELVYYADCKQNKDEFPYSVFQDINEMMKYIKGREVTS